MRTKYTMAGILLICLFLILSGCGELTGTPGSDSGDTGILIRSVSIVGEDAGVDADDEVDVALHYCNEEQTEVEDGLFEHDAILTIDAEASGFADVFPASIEKCTITYLKGNENPEAPIIEVSTRYPNCILEESDTNTCNIPAGIMDVDRKVKWWDDAQNVFFIETYPVHYVTQFDCKYVNQYGDSGTFKVEYDIMLADWNQC